MINAVLNFARRVWAGVRGVASRSRVESEMDDELRSHVEMQTQVNIREGMSLAEARRQALREFGPVERIREEVRDTTRFMWLSDLARDVQLAARMLRRSIGFTITAVMILGLAIGLAATIFSFVRAILLEPLPYRDADRLVVIRSVNPNRELQSNGVSWPDVRDWQQQATSFEGIAAYGALELDLSDGTSTQRIQGMASTANLQGVLGIPLALGRSITSEEVESKTRSMVLGHELWVKRFGGDPDIIGKTQDVYSWRTFPNTGSTTWEIVGVDGFRVSFPPTITKVSGQTPGINDPIEFWSPVATTNRDDRDSRYTFSVVARLKPGVSIEQAAAEMRAIAQQLEAEHPAENAGWTTEVKSFDELVTAGIRPALWLLSGAVAFLLVIACANVASLLIVRGIARQQEFAVRIALGAERGRLIRQLLTESMLLCVAGGAIGILLSVWSVDIVRLLAPPNIPRLQSVTVDGSVLAFAIVLSLLTGVIVGLLPAFLSSMMDVNSALKSEGRAATATAPRRRLMNALVVGELAVSFVLLSGSVLLIRSFAVITSVDPGFRADHLVTLTVSLPQAKYEWNHNSEFCVELVNKLRATPGVTSASAIRGVPTQETHFDSNLHVEGRPAVPINEVPQGKARVIEPGFFETMEVPLLEGRLFRPEDSIGEVGYTKVTVCNETMAKRIFPGESPIGKRFSVIGAGVDPMEIVGVVGDVRFTGLTHEPHVEFYYPEALFPQTEFTLLVRTQNAPESMMGTVERIVRDLEPVVVMASANTMESVLSRSLSRERFLMMLLSAFSVGAFVLSVTGHYGVMSYSVSQRRQELGIRMALGATPFSIVRNIVWHGLLLAFAGLVVGVGVSLVAGRLLESELYGVEATDPATLIAASVIMLLASALAALIPSVRGTRIEPAAVLRGD